MTDAIQPVDDGSSTRHSIRDVVNAIADIKEAKLDQSGDPKDANQVLKNNISGSIDLPVAQIIDPETSLDALNSSIAGAPAADAPAGGSLAI